MKIKNITINKYKVFTREEKIPIDGKNIFIYGENGSGKSSLYYALKDFFQSSVEPIEMTSLRNLSLQNGGIDCSIVVEFDDQKKYKLDENGKNTNIPIITDANRLKSFLTYKHLLGVHNVGKKDEIDIFELIVNGVLKHFKSPILTGDIELGELWRDLLDESKREYGRKKDFYHAKQKKISVDIKLKKFNNAINNLFVHGKPDYLAPDINKILSILSPGLSIEFDRHLPQINDKGEITVPCKILLKITINGLNISNKRPQFALNEAKLSAIAISIFLGMVVKHSPFSPEIKLLFLDDILIGLDMENRLRLLKLLQEKDIPDNEKKFKDFQIFITTYDRHWYEVAKLYLQDWKFIEFYNGKNGPEIIHNEMKPLERARTYFDVYDFPACANSLRKVCEEVLNDKLPQTYTVGDGIKRLAKPLNLETLINHLEAYYKDLGLQPPEKLINALRIYKSILFNPMSHSDIASPIYRHDLELAFETIENLEKILLPTRKIILEKGSMFKLNINEISYQADIELAKDVYLVTNNGVKTISPISFYFKKWTREGIEYAQDKGSPPIPYSNYDKLEQIKKSPFNLPNIVDGINITCSDRNVSKIGENILKENITLQNDTLSKILNIALS